MTTPERRHDLDWIRVGAFSLLILYHVGMFYVPWPWHVKSPRPVEWLGLAMMLTNPWRLSLLFLISGAATRFMADKMAAAALGRQRLARLFLPLLLAVLVIVPPQTYYELVEQGIAPGWSGFYVKYLTASGHWTSHGAPLITPTWNHMWFVAYLLVYTMVLAVLLAFARPLLGRFGQVLERLPPWGLIVWPVLALAAALIILLPIFPITHALVDDWYNHAVYFSLFLTGFSIAKSERLKDAFIRLRWPALAIALVAYALYAGVSWSYRAVEAPQALRLAGGVVFAADQWCAIVAVLGFGAKHLNRGGPVLRYLTLAVFPFYIVHQTIIVVTAHHLAKAGLNQALEAVILVLVTLAGCLLTYEVVRRVGVLRPWFGLKG